MLSIHNLHKSYGIQPILINFNFKINIGEHVGLIGPNGSGKTSLLRILAGIEKPDSGIVSTTDPNLRIGYLAQGMVFDEGQTLQTALGLSTVSKADVESGMPSLANALSVDPNNPTLQAKYDQTIQHLSVNNNQISVNLSRLGLADLPLETPISHLVADKRPA